MAGPDRPPLPSGSQSSGEPRPLHPAGSVQLVLADVIDLGQKVKRFPGSPDTLKPSIALVFQSSKLKPDSKHRFELSQEFTYSAHENALLRKLVGTWLGETMTDDRARHVIGNLADLVGRAGIGAVVHAVKGDKTYVNISSLQPLMDGMVPLTVEGYSRAPYWEKRKASLRAEAEAFLQQQQATVAKEAANLSDFSEPPAGLDTGNDDLPFSPGVLWP